jgi:hypothetical protein
MLANFQPKSEPSAASGAAEVPDELSWGIKTLS